MLYVFLQATMAHKSKLTKIRYLCFLRYKSAKHFFKQHEEETLQLLETKITNHVIDLGKQICDNQLNECVPQIKTDLLNQCELKIPELKKQVEKTLNEKFVSKMEVKLSKEYETMQVEAILKFKEEIDALVEKQKTVPPSGKPQKTSDVWVLKLT